MFKKAQAATEYLIILAVVIIIALIVIGVMGGIPGLGTSGRSRVSESYWSGQTVGVDSYATDSDGDFRITFKNNGRNAVTLTRVELNADGGASTGGSWSGNQVIASGGTATVADTTVMFTKCTTGRSYAYTFNYTFTDSSTGASNIIAGDGGIIKLEGTCASAVS